MHRKPREQRSSLVRIKRVHLEHGDRMGPDWLLPEPINPHLRRLVKLLHRNLL